VLECQHPKNKYTQDNVNDNPAHHHNKPLPRWLRTEFPGLWFALKLFGIHRLVDHPGNLDVATQRQPTDTVLAALVGKLKQLDPPGIEKQVELLHLNPKSARRQKVTKFVQHYQYGQAQ